MGIESELAKIILSAAGSSGIVAILFAIVYIQYHRVKHLETVIESLYNTQLERERYIASRSNELESKREQEIDLIAKAMGSIAEEQRQMRISIDGLVQGRQR